MQGYRWKTTSASGGDTQPATPYHRPIYVTNGKWCRPSHIPVVRHTGLGVRAGVGYFRQVPLSIHIVRHPLRNATAGATQRVITASGYDLPDANKLHIKSAARQVGEAFAERMRDYIDKLVVDGEDVNAASVALHFQVSYAYVKAVFKAHAGQPIGGYIRRCKLEQACLMLKAGEPPLQVARYICWSYGHFNKAFKARYGVSPREYKG